MSVTEGMDVERVRASERALLRHASEMEGARQGARRAASRLTEVWQGPDAQHFQHRWRGAERHLVLVEDGVRRLAAQLQAQARGQEQVSSVESGPVGGALPSGGGTPPGDGVGSNPGLRDKDDQSAYEPIEGPVVQDGASPEDVMQGALGDCWLISTMRGVAAANPELIADNIRANDDGTYTITLYERGEPVEVTVTAEFPAVDGDPTYADNEGERELWPLLYEKAMAQHMGGSYEDLDGDWPSRAIEAMTGEPVQTYDEGFFPWDNKDLPPAADLRSRLEDGGVIIASTNGDGDKASAGELVSNHAYTVTGIDDDGNVTVQNPWGSHEPPITMTYEEFEERFARFDVGSARK